MYKNVASQKVLIFATSKANGNPWTADVASTITGYISKDGGTPVASNDVNPTNVDHTRGLYAFDLTQAETNCDLFGIIPESSDVLVRVTPVFIYTSPQTSDANVVQLGGQSTIYGQDVLDIAQVLLAHIAGVTTGASEGAGAITFKDPTGAITKYVITVDANGNRTLSTIS